MTNFELRFDFEEMIQALKNNGYEIKKEQRSDYNTTYHNNVEVFERSVYIVYLGGHEVVDTSYPCRYNNLDIVEDIFSKILKKKLLKLVSTI